MAFLKNVGGSYSVNDVYGIDPAAPESGRDYVELVRQFRPANGLFIADFPGGWVEETLEHARQFPEVERLRAEEALRRLRRASMWTVRHAAWSPRMRWHEQAPRLQDACAKVRELIGSADSPCAITRPLRDLFDDANALLPANEALLNTQADDYIDAMMPLLMHAPKIVLVDPYLHSAYYDKGRWNRASDTIEFVRKLLTTAADFRHLEILTLYWNPKKHETLRRLQHDDLCSEAKPFGVEIEIREYDDSHEALNHPRYALTKWGGLKFDKGFAFGKRGAKNQVSWISERVLEDILSVFYDRR